MTERRTIAAGPGRRWVSARTAILGALVCAGAVLVTGLAGCGSDPLAGIPEPGEAAPGPTWHPVRQPAPMPSVLLVTLDTTRRDRVGCYGYDPPTTPTLDRLAASGVLFERAVAPTPVTLPSHATILTGRDPQEHGVRNNGAFVLPATEITLAEILRAAGYATGATLGAFPVAAQFGLNQGFSEYDDAFPGHSRLREWQTVQRTADEVTDRALEWFRAHAAGRPGRPFFHWVHYFDPHFPYVPPEPYASRFEEPYDGEIAFMDAQLGRLLDELEELGLLANTWILCVGDHGEALGEHGEETHSMLIYGATQWVPCLLVPPRAADPVPGGSLEGRRMEDVIGLRDLAPTLINALGLPANRLPASGRSLLPMLAGDGSGPQVVYSETLVPFLEYGWSELRGVRSQRWSYIRAPEPELYDLQADPDETESVVTRFPEVVARLEAWCAHFVSDAEGAQPVALDPATVEKLRSLGYVAGSAPQGPAANEKNPVELMPLLQQIHQARTDLGAQRPLQARVRLEEVLGRDPGNPEAQRLLASALLRLGEGEQALAVYDRLAEIGAGGPELAVHRARAQLVAGRCEDAARELRGHVEDHPEDDDAALLRAEVLACAGRAAEGAELLRRVAAQRPEEAQPLANRAAFAWGQGDTQDAVELARRVLAVDADDPTAHALLGEWFWQQARDRGEAGDETGAEEDLAAARHHVERALDVDPLEPMASFRMGWMLRRAGETERAIEYYQRALAARPNMVAAHINLGNLLRETGRSTEALRHYDVARGIGSDSPAFWVNYGMALVEAGRRSEAERAWEHALTLNPDPAMAAGIRGNLQRLRGPMR